MMKAITIIAGLILLTVSGCALQEDVIILEERLMALERQNQRIKNQNDNLRGQLQEQLSLLDQSSQSAEKSLRTQYAGINANLDSTKDELQLLNGRIEEIEHTIDRKMSDVEATAGRLDEANLKLAEISQRLDQVEQYLSIDRTNKQKAKAPTGDAKAEAKAPGSDQQLYESAKQAYDNGQWDKARQEFDQLIKSYPRSSNADNAQFWIGESYYREKWYKKAILEYQTVIEKYPKGNKVPAAMLKQGLSFVMLGDKSNARLVLNELVRKYPRSNEANIAAKKLKEL